MAEASRGPRKGIRIVGAGVEEDEPVTLDNRAPAARPRKPERARSQKSQPKAGAKEAPAKLWAGRLGARTARRVEEYTESLSIDQRLYADDIDVSIAHARMLRRSGILGAAEVRTLEAALRDIRREFERDDFTVQPSDEDIHSAIERRLHEIAGPVAGKIQTARSRNDQIAADLRLYVKRSCREMVLGVAGLQEALLRKAQSHRTTVMPGYTHLQRGQIVSLAHHLLAYVEMLQRDIERLIDVHERSDVSPLGSGALAATTLPIDRRFVADDLGFDQISANSMDAVSDRDFAVEMIAACALLMVHLSRLAEEIVLWTSSEWHFAELPDTHATGSSLMPQKKNPDVLELLRGRSARVTGDVVAILGLLKGLPLTYNRDLQEDKRSLFDAVDVTGASLEMLTEVIRVLHIDHDAMRQAAQDPALLATDVAEYLVARGIPFREAHTIVGAAVRDSARQKRTLRDLDASEWRTYSDRFEENVVELFDVERALRRREIPGGPGPKMVSRQLVRAATLVAKTRRMVPVLAKQVSAVKEVGAAARKR